MNLLDDLLGDMKFYRKLRRGCWMLVKQNHYGSYTRNRAMWFRFDTSVKPELRYSSVLETEDYT